MSDKIKPSEVSQVLLDQLQGISTNANYDEAGTVLTVSDGVARIYGLRNAEANELLEFENGTMAIVMNLEEDNVGCVLLGPTSGIKEGQIVKRTKRIASIRVNDNMLGRVINPIGQAIDGKGAIDLTDSFEMPLDRKAPGVIYRQPVKQPLQTGIKAVDSMIPIGRGQRELIIGDRQTGKTAIAIDTIINQKSFYEAGKPVYCIYVAIGQKASTIAALVQNLKERGALPYTIIVAATASDPAIVVNTHSLSTMTSRSRLLPTVRYRSSSVVLLVVRHIPATSFTFTLVSLSVLQRLTSSRKLPSR